MIFETPRNDVEAKICDLEKQIYELKEQCNELLEKLPPEEVKNYSLKTVDGNDIQLLDLFGDKDELILIHNMGPGCPYCTLWADGFKGFTPYLNERCAFWMETDKEPAELKEFSEKRGWSFNVVSSIDSGLKLELGFQKESDGKTFNLPGFSTFFKEDGKIYRHATAPFGPGDDYCGVWPMLAHLKKGANGWQPKFNL